MNFLKKIRLPALTLSAKITVTVTLYLALALTMLTGMIVHLQKQTFSIKARESAATAIAELSTALFNKWRPQAPVARNVRALSAYGDLRRMVFENDFLAYIVFQDSKGEVRYIAKSLPEYVWMMRHTSFDPYTRRLLAMSGSAKRTLSSYPEGAVTEYISSVKGPSKEPLGEVRAGISEKRVSAAAGQLSMMTMLKIAAVNLLALVFVALVVFSLASAIERRLYGMHRRARQMLDSGEPRSDADNVLVHLTREFDELENLVTSLKSKFIELAITISHEFRSPLQAIEGYADFLRKGCAGPVTPLQDKYLKIIGENAERFQGFIDNVMDLVRLGGGGLALHPAAFKAADVVSRAQELFAKQAAENNIRLKTVEPDPGLQAYGDSSRIYQILVNLLANALKFTPPQGTIEIGFAGNNSAVEFFVSDTGPGIPPEAMGKLFSEFYQVPGAQPVRGYKGLGIGLALCKKLIQAQGGAIRAESEPGKGTSVYFTLPSKPRMK
ncbi:MAG: HAMP domain-containing sensor histidine kinase [Elusimicrobiales bacterium]|nr:HAMP domain-containing sensor histidine kinase [Elusimicrobiales bacterium]